MKIYFARFFSARVTNCLFLACLTVSLSAIPESWGADVDYPYEATGYDSLDSEARHSLADAISEARRLIRPLTEQQRMLPENKKARFLASNPRNELNVRFLDTGIRLFSGREGSEWQGELSLKGNKEAVEIRHQDLEISYDYGNIIEWYKNRPEGIEQGWTVKAPPAGSEGVLRVYIDVAGLTVEPLYGRKEGSSDLQFVDTNGVPVLAYKNLSVFDAFGRELVAQMRPLNEGFEVLVEANVLSYPVIIDPLIVELDEEFGPTFSEAASGDNFGTSVGISGDVAIVGAPKDDDNGNNAGAAFMFSKENGSWAFRQKLLASDGNAGDRFGSAVSIEGNTAAVGAPLGGIGKVYVFEMVNRRWAGEVILDGWSENVFSGGGFGCSLSISGDRILVGAKSVYFQNSSYQGAAYIFEHIESAWVFADELLPTTSQLFPEDFGTSVSLDGDTALVGSSRDSHGRSAGFVFGRGGDSWNLNSVLIMVDEEPSDRVGASVALDGDIAILGAPGDDTNGGIDAGSAVVFERSGNTWTQTKKLKADNARNYDAFGSSVSVRGNVAIIGSPLNDINGVGEDAGSAYIFEKSGNSWEQKTNLKGIGAGDEFGRSVFLDDYNQGIVGAKYNDDFGSNAGSAYIYSGSGNSWTEDAALSAQNLASDDQFGEALSISGDTLVVGAEDDDDNGADAGAAYVFHLNSGEWELQAKLLAEDGAAGDNFGAAVSVDGVRILVGSPDDDYNGFTNTGSVFSFVSSGAIWSREAVFRGSSFLSDNRYFGTAVSLDGNYALIGSRSDVDSPDGSASVFVSDGNGAWSFLEKLIPSDLESGDSYGSSLALDEDTAFIAAFADSGNGQGANSGSVHVYDRTGSSWNHNAKLMPSDGNRDGSFGISIGLQGDLAVIGASGADVGGNKRGQAYIFTRVSGDWNESSKLSASDGADNDDFGRAVALDGDKVFVGVGGLGPGKAYLFELDEDHWVETGILASVDSGSTDRFGYSVGLSGNKGVVGAVWDHYSGSDSGSVYFMDFTEYPRVNFELGDLGVWVGGGELVQRVVYDGAALEPVFNVSDTWQFTEWDASLDNITADVTITAQYEQIIFTVDFDLGAYGTRIGGGELSQQVDRGDSALEPEFEVEPGWDFTGWDLDIDNVTEDLLVTAQYEQIYNTVDFDLGDYGTRTGGGELSQQIVYGGAASEPELEVDSGWSFVGWDSPFDNIISAQTITALYRETHTVTFSAGKVGRRIGGGTLTQEILDGDAANAPLIEADEGWIFTGWDVPFDNITGDLSVTAQYEPVILTVDFDLGAQGTRTGGGELSQQITYGNAADAPEFTVASGWGFVGWDLAFENVQSDLTVTAQYIEQYTVVFDIGSVGTWTGGGELSQEIQPGGSAEEPEFDVGDGWLFAGWDTSFDSVNEDLTVTAQFISGYVVEFDLGSYGNLVSGDLLQTLAEGSSAAAPEFSVALGWSLIGWSGSFSDINSDKVITAQYAATDLVAAVEEAGLVLGESEGGASDRFGQSVSICGDTAVISEHLDDSGNPNQGSVWVYVRDEYGGWVPQQKLTADNGSADDEFGFSAVSISGDTIAVGARKYDHSEIGEDVGTVYVFVRNNGVWAQEAQLFAQDVDGSNMAIGDFFGVAVGISGDHLIVGASKADDHGTDSGSAYFYKREQGAWEFATKVTAGNVEGESEARFGRGVSISGDTAVVSMHRSDGDTGSAFVFICDSDGNWNREAIIAAPRGQAGDQFGLPLSISGDTIAVAARLEDSRFYTDVGAVYIFNRYGNVWVEDSKIEASDGGEGDRFGSALDLSGDILVIGAERRNNSKGSAYVFRNPTGFWEFDSMLSPNSVTLSQGDQLGASVSICGDLAIIGANGIDTPAPDSGGAFVFDLGVPPITVEFDLGALGTRSGGGELSQTIKYGESASTPTLSVVDGWQFAGWDIPYHNVTSDLSVTAQYVKLHTVVFDIGDYGTRTGGGELSQVVVDGDAALEPEFSVTSGWQFVGWDSVFVSIDTDITVTAEYVKLHTVVFDIGDYGTRTGGGELSQIVEDGDPAVEPIIELVDGWYFGDWDQSFDVVTTDLTVTAFYVDRLSYSVTFDLGIHGAVLSGELGQSVLAGSDAIPPEFAVAEGWAFVGWDLSFQNIQADMSVTAQYVPSDLVAILEEKILDADGDADDRYGRSVGVSGDTVVVSAHLDDENANNSGALVVYIRDENGAWNEQAKLRASDAALGDELGRALAIDGDTIVAGAWLADASGVDSGAAYIFVRENGAWFEQAKLIGSTSLGGDKFGDAVGISEDTVVIGAWHDDTMGSGAGAVYVFERFYGVWGETTKITPADGAAGDNFGISVAVDGDVIIAGANGVDDVASNAGSAYIFERTDDSWERNIKLVRADGAQGDRFGRSVAVSGDSVLISMHFDDTEALDQGSAYIYTRSGDTWAEQQRLVGSDGAAGDEFGWSSVSLSGDIAVIGARHDDDAGDSSGSAYVFQRQNSNWVETAKLTASDADLNDQFGIGVAVNGDIAVVGANLEDADGLDSGSAYIFDLGTPPVSVEFDLGDYAIHDGGGALSQTIKFGTDAIEPALVVSEGWQFVGWNEAFEMVEQDITVSAIYTGDTVDLDEDGVYDFWERINFGNITVTDGVIDSDGDGRLDAEEFKSGSDPLDRSSFFRILGFSGDDEVSHVTIEFTSGTEVVNRRYRILYKASLTDPTWLELAPGVFEPDAGDSTTRSFPNPVSNGNGFFIVEGIILE
ncbi:MAG: FG-GAP repeat protein [Opitutales bacterium]